MTSFNEPTGRPGAGEYAAYAEMDIMRVAGNDAPSALQTQRDEMLALLDGLADDAVRGVTYAPGKWTLKEVVGHLVDDERIFTYRLLCVARGDQTPQPDEGSSTGTKRQRAGWRSTSPATNCGTSRRFGRSTCR